MKEEKKMEYEFCMCCPHSEKIYLIGGGLILLCKITGNKLEVTKCPEP